MRLWQVKGRRGRDGVYGPIALNPAQVREVIGDGDVVPVLVFQVCQGDEYIELDDETSYEEAVAALNEALKA